ncbi:hypothetical protein ABZY31_18390 [Streptomyces sp. NPDC006529]|uniref:hypothetical protein n=1 Tax=Streptomyces sp. NPDC006529 TaxID=3157177 RepID=UPI0033BED051
MLARRLRFGAVLVAVVFALTGFSTGKHKSSSGGHGCSSSKSTHRTSTSGGTSGSGGSGSSSTRTPSPSPTRSGPPAHAVIVSCAGPSSAVATVRVTSDVDTTRTVNVPVVSLAAGVAGEDYGSVRVTLAPRETKTVSVQMNSPGDAAKVRSCRVGPIS